MEHPAAILSISDLTFPKNTLQWMILGIRCRTASLSSAGWDIDLASHAAGGYLDFERSLSLEYIYNLPALLPRWLLLLQPVS